MTKNRCIYCLFLLAAFSASTASAEEAKGNRFNVLFIAIDDLNDWVGCLGGNPQAITPNFDRFARNHAMVMNRAYCPSTVCGPTRTALLTGKHATNTGVYGNGHNLKHAPKAQNLETLPEYFGNRGYHTLTRGKIFHKHGDPNAPNGVDEGQWAFHEFVKAKGSNGLTLWEEKPALDGVKSGGSPFTWGAVKGPKEKTKDYATCSWAAKQLERDFKGKPFFMAVGVSKPHLPWHVPQEFFDLYSLEEIEAASFKRNDLDDIVRKNGKPIFKPTSRFRLADENNMHKQANRAYLACVSYADHSLGVLFDALEKSKHANNTIVMIWGDHGWHLSEKMHYGKTGLWEESARVPFFVNVPGLTTPNTKCDGVVNLLDMYPTLLELCGLPPNPKNDGRSFAPLLANPSMEWKYPTLTTYQFKNHSITDGRYRYTWYGGRADGAEELYDHDFDPLEHDNLANNPEYKAVIVRLRKHLPTHHEPESPSNPHNVLKNSKVPKQAEHNED